MSKILQFKLNQQALAERLNPGAAVESAGDCGANCIYVLGKINGAEAVELSARQNLARAQFQQGHALDPIVTAPFLFGKYLFDNIAYTYDIVVIQDVHQLIASLDELNLGYGTIVMMNVVDQHGHIAVGHYIVVEKDIEGNLTIKDLQGSTVIERMDFMAYFSQYNMFSIPSVNKKHSQEGEMSIERRRKFAGKKSKGKKSKRKKTKRNKY